MSALRPAPLKRRLGAALALLALAWLLAMPGWALAAAQAVAGPGADICRAPGAPGESGKRQAPADHCTLCPGLGQAPALPVALATVALHTAGLAPASQPVLPPTPLLPRRIAQARAPPAVG